VSYLPERSCSRPVAPHVGAEARSGHGTRIDLSCDAGYHLLVENPNLEPGWFRTKPKGDGVAGIRTNRIAHMNLLH
jgi:hypothetical protein